MWSRNRGDLLLGLVALVVLAAGASLSFVRAPSRVRVPFQAATGGVGLSSSMSADWSFFGFDPRSEGFCENELQPLPGLSCPNPGHGTKVADLPPLRRLGG